MTIDEIYEIIKTNNITKLSELQASVNLSESTIRRRLKAMEEVGLLEVARGGQISLINETNISVSDEYRIEQNKINKVRIAKEAASLIEDDDIVFIDNGTTVRYILKYLQANNVTIYTNGYHHIETAKKYNRELNLIPGQVLPNEASIVGEAAIMYLSQINFDKCFVGANGYSEQFGVTTPHLAEANLKCQALMMAYESYILVDESKKDRVLKYKICDLTDYTIIN